MAALVDAPMGAVKCQECGMSQLVISWSALRLHEECRQKAKLMRQGKKSPSTDIRVFFHGTVVDRVMRDWLTDDPYKPENKNTMPDMVRAVMEREEKYAKESGDGIVRWKHANDKKEVEEFCVELVTRLEPILEELVLPFEYEPAKRFKVPIQIPYLNGEPTTIMLAGEMDLLVRDDEGEFHIWDLKGTKDDGYWRKTIAQNTFYDISAHAMFGQHTKNAGLIQPMCKQRVLPVPITDQARAELMQRVIAMATKMWQYDWEPRQDNKICGYCAVRASCIKFQPVNGRMSIGGMRSMTDLAAGVHDGLLPG